MAEESNAQPKTKVADKPIAVCSAETLLCEDNMQCGLCGSFVSKDCTRILSKRAQTYKCLKCYASCTRLVKARGLPDDDKWSTEKKQAFWNKIKDKTRSDTCRIAEEYSQLEYKSDEKMYENNGKFFPLKVWAVKGFPADDIKEKSLPENIRIDPVIGTTYRVVIQSSGNRGKEGRSESRAHNVREPEAKEPEDIDTLRTHLAEREKAIKAQQDKEKQNSQKMKALETSVTALVASITAHGSVLPVNLTESAMSLKKESAELKVKAKTQDVGEAFHPLSGWISFLGYTCAICDTPVSIHAGMADP